MGISLLFSSFLLREGFGPALGVQYICRYWYYAIFLAQRALRRAGLPAEKNMQKVLELAQRSVIKQEALLLSQFGEEDRHDSTGFHAENHSLAELGVHHLLTGGQTGHWL